MSAEPKAGAEIVVAARQATHGDWLVTAAIAIRLKAVVASEWLARIGRGLGAPSAGQAEALDQICVKIARILSGDPAHADHWRDIHGYLHLVEPSAGVVLGDETMRRRTPPLAGGDRFTGDACPDCGGLRMVRTGTCSTCLDCGTSGGCG